MLFIIKFYLFLRKYLKYMRNDFRYFAIVSTILVAAIGYFWQPFLWVFVVLIPLILVGIYDMNQTKHAIMRTFPLVGRGRYWMEWLRPKIYQYFVESDIDGRPFSRTERSIVYQRAKKDVDTTPFGTQLNVYEEGYEWMNHSIAARNYRDLEQHPRVLIGGKDCKQPYSASIYNVSAMSFGSLSTNAVLALNGGAKIGNFAHNTGEGGISEHHLTQGGDLIYQVGTGYFGSRDKEGNFSPEAFSRTASHPNVKMIELKLSQGAKPGHGGILPAKKNTPEIAKIRGVEPHTEVLSPPYHKAFNTPIGLCQLIGQMRELSGGKPVGFKLCVGHKSEFLAICKAMIKTGIKPDFISVDGGEGGTGAAPLEFSDFVGMPYREALAFVHDALTGFGLREDIKIIAAGKIVSGFHLFRALALGADACYTARAMMMALGCIQALECNRNTCPTGVATQDPELVEGLVVGDKKVRVANFHKATVHSFVELLGASGLENAAQIRRSMINRRVTVSDSKRYDELFPYLKKGCLLDDNTTPQYWKAYLNEASAETFSKSFEDTMIG
jgi:glutamate synthase domain-containing protein 2